MIKIGGNTAQKVFPKKSGTKGRKTMKLSLKMALTLGFISAFVICVMNICTVHNTRISFTQALDKNMEDKGRASSEELSSMISKMNAISSIIYNGVNSEEDGKGDWIIKNLQEERQTVTPMKESGFRSRVVDAELNMKQYNSESVLLESLSALIASDENIVGAGAFFEPDGFVKVNGDYAPYLSKNDYSTKTLHNFSYDHYKVKEYYTEAQESKKTVITEVYEDLLSGAKVFTISQPLYAGNRFIGVVLLDVDVNIFSSIQQEDSRFPSLYSDILDAHGNVMYSKNAGLIGKSVSESKSESEYRKMQEEMEKGKIFHLTEKDKGGEETRVYYIPTDVMGSTWWIMLSVKKVELMSPVVRLIFICTAFAFFAVMVLALTLYFLIKKSLKPLEGMARVGKKVSKGDFSESISYLKDDEIGQIGQGFKQVTENIREITSDLEEKLEELSRGNFRVDLEDEEKYQGEYRPLIDSLRNIRSQLNGTILEIQKSASEVSSTSEQVSNGAQSLSQGATEQASSVEELSASMSEIADSIKVTTKKAEDAKGLSERVGEAVTVSTGKMEEMTRAMAEITEKSTEIEKIIKTIDDIAFQTNILSLNAAIEAARAGEAGKGFAVVADEVGNLAQKSAKAAQNTGLLIEETKDAVERGAKISRETGESLSTVVERAGKINTMIFEITKETERESEGMSQLTVGMEQISAVVQTNSATAEESAAASEELSGQAAILDDLVSKFQLQEG